ncbi:pleckstrin homology domain-containing family A member 4-like [Lytechinus variegatus]|uniref:pleckstrin homology domain-containing family A member 4-like n=1 Tax=Lytechinus variegatus TaxID=7654 RepID=UPI001BB19618|nr:pleckstrin homology domain-containing family A member 4-like [Lytechinus variegatus]
MDTDTPDAPQMYAPNNQQSAPPNSHYPESPQSPTLSVKPSFKKRTIPKTEAPKVKRREGAVVSKDGWLQKKDSSGLGVWRKRWCVISDFCLFYYKGADEVNQAGTVMLPSYIIKPVEPRDKITKKFAFKCEHSNMRTYYFAAESDDLMHQWIDALNDASQVNLDRGYGNQDEIDWGSSPLRSPKSLRRNEEPPTNGNYPNGSAHPRQHSPNRSGTGPPRQGGWGNYEDIEFGDRPGGETSLKNGLGPDRSLLQQSSRESWEGSQPRSNHDNGSYSSSQEERRSGQNSHLSPPRSPSLHSSSSRDHSYMDDKPKDPNAGYNYVDISEIKERKRQNQLDSQGSYNDDPRPGDPRSAQHQRSSSRHHDDRGSLGSGHSGHRNGRDEMDGGHPYHDPRVEINVSMATDPDQSWGQRSEAQRSSNPRRSESRRSNASQRSISEPSHQRGLAPMEEVPVTRASTERLHSAPRREESSYQQSTPPRGREPPMHDRVPPEHGRMPPQHGRVPSDYARVPQGHVRSPSEYSRSPSEYSRSPSEYSRSPSEYSRGPPQQGRGSRGPPPQQQHGRGPAQHGRAPHEAGMAPHGRMPPPGHGRGQPRQGRAPPHQRQDHVRVPSHHGQGRPRQGQGRGYPPQGGAPHHQERMPIQQSRAPQEHSRVPPNQGRPHSMHGRPPPQHDRTPSRASTMPRDMSPSHSPARGSDRDSIDAAPTRRTYSASSTSLNRNDTLKRQELEKDDEVAPLQPLGARQAAPKTGRYRMWQQKTQQFVDLSTGIRLRLSIAAGDLVGKSHEELVLFLIQLRRDKANLQEWLAMIDNELTLLRDPNSSSANSSRLRPRSNESLRRSPPDLSEDDQEYYQEILTEREDIARELDISAPLINLVDNLVRMGSLYGGDNHMIAQEFYGDKVQKGLPYSPPKKLIEFSRRLEEEKLVQDLEDELRQLETAEDVELQEKLDQLYDLDKTLQEISARVSVLKDEKDKIENTLQRLDQQITHDWDDKEMVAKIEEQQRQLERQLTRVRGQLAQGTKELEEITAENSRIEHEVALMRFEKGLMFMLMFLYFICRSLKRSQLKMELEEITAENSRIEHEVALMRFEKGLMFMLMFLYFICRSLKRSQLKIVG